MSRPIMLIDGNNFFVSCERIFRPDLRNKPTIVLSSNDGCAIARSAEAKALGIKMGQPYFQFREFGERNNLTVLSANFGLYTEISERVRTILEQFSPNVNPYSIDESFVDLSGFEHRDLAVYGREIRAAILQQVGIPTGVGIGPTKTLAKAANWAAKKFKQLGWIADIYTDPSRARRMLELMPIEEVWGVGKASAGQLKKLNVNTALQLADADRTLLRKHFSIATIRTAEELSGKESLPWEADTALNQQVIATRSLGTPVDDPQTLFSSIAHHIGRGARKLRGQGAVACQLSIMMRTNGFANNKAQYAPSATTRLRAPTADTSILTSAAKQLFERIYRSGYLYAKSGITLSEISPAVAEQTDLFAAFEVDEESSALMSAVDAINRRFGKNLVSTGSVAQGDSWQPKADFLSPHYLARWSDIPTARARVLQQR